MESIVGRSRNHWIRISVGNGSRSDDDDDDDDDDNYNDCGHDEYLLKGMTMKTIVFILLQTERHN